MAFELPTVQSCCCGCSLRTGSLILLWLYLLNGFLWVGTPVISPLIPNQPTNGTKNSSMPGSMPGSVHFDNVYPFSQYVATAAGLVDVIVSLLGLYAVYKEKHPYLLPFLLWEIIDIIVIFVTFIALLFAPLGGSNLVVILYIIVRAYFWIVVYSQYLEIKGTSRSAA